MPWAGQGTGREQLCLTAGTQHKASLGPSKAVTKGVVQPRKWRGMSVRMNVENMEES